MFELWAEQAQRKRADGLQHLDTVDEGLGCQIDDAGAFVWLDLDQALPRKDVERLSNRRQAGAELPRNLGGDEALPRQVPLSAQHGRLRVQ